jgi:hypothetical protein
MSEHLIKRRLAPKRIKGVLVVDDSCIKRRRKVGVRGKCYFVVRGERRWVEKRVATCVAREQGFIGGERKP